MLHVDVRRTSVVIMHLKYYAVFQILEVNLVLFLDFLAIPEVDAFCVDNTKSKCKLA